MNSSDSTSSDATINDATINDATINDPTIIVALDFSDLKTTLDLAATLDPALCRVKVGKELFTQVGPEVIRRLHDLKYDVFLDLKFHDIPNTVANACAAAADLGVWMVNVHASGGRRMMEAARDKLANKGTDIPLLIAVTVLTSSSQQDLSEIGILDTPADQVKRLAVLTNDSGLDGVVCSAQEAKLLRQLTGPEFKLVTPGIRPIGSDSEDQRRICTPVDAIANGADYLVIGRPITQAADPLAVLQQLALTLS